MTILIFSGFDPRAFLGDVHQLRNSASFLSVVRFSETLAYLTWTKNSRRCTCTE